MVYSICYKLVMEPHKFEPTLLRSVYLYETHLTGYRFFSAPSVLLLPEHVSCRALISLYYSSFSLTLSSTKMETSLKDRHSLILYSQNLIQILFYKEWISTWLLIWIKPAQRNLGFSYWWILERWVRVEWTRGIHELPHTIPVPANGLTIY